MFRVPKALKIRSLNDLRLWLAAITLLIIVLKILIIPYPWPELSPPDCVTPPFNGGNCGFIFDEAHYIPAVRKMFWGEAANNEHPPLSKALMMLGIKLFGDNPYGWRFFITLSGAASVYLVGLIAYELTKSYRTSIISAILFGFDITSFNLSSIAMLDAPALMFSLLGALLFLRKRLILSGLALGFALLSKTSTPLVVAAILFYDLLKDSYGAADVRSALRKWIRVVEKIGFTAAVVFLLGLAVYDYSFHAFATPFEHLDYILNYHSSLTFSEKDLVYLPLSWANPLFPFPRRAYYVITVSVDSKETYHPIAYYGMQTPLWWMTWVVAAFSAYLAYLKLRDGHFPRFEFFTLSWFAFNYLSFFPMAYILHRWVYPFYFYMTVPVIAIGLPEMLLGDRFSEAILYALTAIQIIWFFIYFPVKPQWFIDFLLSLGAPV